jgi:transcriptional regulator GlxA family with amidase domain
MERTATTSGRKRLFDEAAAIVHAEYATDLQLGELARRLASSPRQLQRAFDQIGATTFRTHLATVRMDRAAELLADEELAVRDVARLVGYSQPAQFAKAFRRRHRAAPTTYRAARADA